jgi:hypothetical protein
MTPELPSDADNEGKGAWIPRGDEDGAISEEESEEEEQKSENENGDLESPEESESDEGSDGTQGVIKVGAGRFGALQDAAEEEEGVTSDEETT